MPEIIVIEPTQNPCTRPKRVAAYCRVSSDSEDQLHSYYAQVRYYTDQLAQMKDAVSAGIYADEGITGTEMRKRSEFLRLIEDCRRGKIDRIVTKSISRFARNTLESLETARMLKALGISIYFEEDHLDTATMSSEAILTLKSAAAQAGSQSISKNVKMGKRMKMKNGTFVTNMVPFGYRYMEREAVPDPKQAEIVRRIFREYKNGSGAHVIAKRLNAEEIPSTDGGRWHESHITRILGNPYYTGVMVMQKTYRTDAFPYVQKKNYGEQQWYCKYRAQEAIIDWQEFQLVQEILAARREQHRRPPSAAEKPPLWQKVICGVCGHTYNRRVNSTGRAAWVCSYHSLNRTYCPAMPIPEQLLYLAFSSLCCKLRTHRDRILSPAIEQLNTAKEFQRRGNLQIGEIDRRIADLSGQNLLLVRLKAKGYLDEQDYLEQKGELDAALAAARKERMQLRQEDELDEALEKLTALQEILDDDTKYSPGFSGEVFRSLVEKVTVHGSALRFRLFCGLELKEFLEGEGETLEK